MTKTEYARVAAEVADLWPGSKWEVRTVRAGEALLLDLDAAVVLAAVCTLAALGERWPPHPGQVRRQAVELANPTPSADEALTEAYQWAARAGSGRTPEWSHPAIGAAVAAMGGTRYLSQSTDQMADRAHFLRIYGEAAERHTSATLMPPSVAALLSGLDLSADRAIGSGR